MQDETFKVYEIDSLNRSRDTKLLVIPEARNTILSLVIGAKIQSFIKIKRADIDRLLNQIDHDYEMEGGKYDLTDNDVRPITEEIA